MKHSHRRRRSVFKAKVGLTAAMLLTFSGPVAAQAAEKTYDSVSRWGATEATKGDSITVNEVNGWGSSEKDPVHLTVGTKDTQNVTVHNYSAGEGSTTEVHGRNISFGGNYHNGVVGNFWLSKGQITVGDENTKTISMTHLRGGDEAKITVNGGTDSLKVGEVSLGQSTVRVGGANTGKVTAESISLWGQWRDGKTYGADAVIDGTQGITVNKNVSATTNSKLQLGTENNKGDVQIRNEESNGNAVSADSGSTIAITAGGKISAAGNVNAVSGNSAIDMHGAGIDINGRVMATGSHYGNEKAPQISLTAEDSNGKRGNVNVQGFDVDSQGSITVKGDVVTIDDSKVKQQQDYSIHSTNGSVVSIDSTSLTMNKGVAFQGGGEMNLKADKKVIIGPSADLYKRSLEMTGGKLYVGGKEAETALNGSVSILDGYGKESAAAIDGNKITINASITPDEYENSKDPDWLKNSKSMAIYNQDVDLTIGNEGTSRAVPQSTAISALAAIKQLSTARKSQSMVCTAKKRGGIRLRSRPISRYR